MKKIVYILKETSKKFLYHGLVHNAKINTEVKMAEINNNIPNFGPKVDKINKKETQRYSQPENKIEDIKQNEYVPDTGVIGRSQIKAKNNDISKSVMDAVNLAKSNPALLKGSETIFEKLSEEYTKQGMQPSEAYEKALIAEEEFLAMAQQGNY